MVLIRHVASRDVADLVRMETAGSGFTYGAYVFIRQMQELAGPAFFVADDEGSIVGYTIGCVSSASRRKGWILRLKVEPEHQGRGIGRLLTTSIEEALQELGTQEICLTVSPKNTGAIALYESRGFQRVSFEAEYFGPGEDRMIMQKTGAGQSPEAR
ncbi:MAG: N-acetyltransferase [Methanocalculus sp. MSAO_Arc1]|uniref:GNAT family N-acetyltransferase n=1 Tax=Methanocalculus TaxID=71151 RepID=UPI000FF7AF3A|nr:MULTISPECIES: N-acetyltransferase [unclassified Methanocalculus]MCP1662170.1 ribosomal-protein-alanine N-acetyltransferase [Methanocalculus sp. AMF5]RQD79100.1 MAG: N-acetyltransferase [Methanocalculus sp. MSAO_Arc1]